MASTSAQGSGAVTRGRTPVSHITNFLGKGRLFIPSELPTLRDVLRYALYLQEQKLLVEGINLHNYPTDEITGDVIPVLLSQWTRANVKFAPPVIISERRIKARIRNAWTKARNIAKWKVLSDFSSGSVLYLSRQAVRHHTMPMPDNRLFGFGM